MRESGIPRLSVPKFLINGKEPQGRTVEAWSAIIEEELKNQGYKISDLKVGDTHTDEMNVIVKLSTPDENLKSGDSIIKRIIKPAIMKDGKVVQVAEVEVAVGTKELTAEEFKQEEIKLEKVNNGYK